MEILRLKEISKEFDGKVALRNVSFGVNRGEILSIIGPNGAGKTTLLRIMAFLEPPTAGEIFFNGVKVEEPESFRKKITMVFQEPVFFGSTVFDNIAYGLRVRGYSEADVRKKVEESLSIVNLEGCEKRRVKALSGGEQQRVVLARALALDTEVLLLDEPAASLDPMNTKIVEDLIRDLRGKTTTVIATHHLSQARRLSDRVAFLYEGVLLEVGKTREVFLRPKQERTEKFIRGELF